MVFTEYKLKKLNYLRKPMVFTESDLTWAEKAEETNGFHCVWAATNRRTWIIIWFSMVWHGCWIICHSLKKAEKAKLSEETNVFYWIQVEKAELSEETNCFYRIKTEKADLS